MRNGSLLRYAVRGSGFCGLRMVKGIKIPIPQIKTVCPNRLKCQNLFFTFFVKEEKLLSEIEGVLFSSFLKFLRKAKEGTEQEIEKKGAEVFHKLFSLVITSL